MGVGFVNFDDLVAILPLVDEGDTVFGFHVGAGVSFDVTETIELEAGYRYMRFLNARNTAIGPPAVVPGNTDVGSHNVTLGLRFKL